MRKRVESPALGAGESHFIVFIFFTHSLFFLLILPAVTI